MGISVSQTKGHCSPSPSQLGIISWQTVVRRLSSRFYSQQGANRETEVAIVASWRNTKRYSWWVRTADEATTQIDMQRTKRPPFYGLLGRPEIVGQIDIGWKHLKPWIDDDTPGRGLPDIALHYAFSSYFTGSSYIEGGFKMIKLDDALGFGLVPASERTRGWWC
jgi:hypothetical protein